MRTAVLIAAIALSQPAILAAQTPAGDALPSPDASGVAARGEAQGVPGDGSGARAEETLVPVPTRQAGEAMPFAPDFSAIPANQQQGPAALLTLPPLPDFAPPARAGGNAAANVAPLQTADDINNDLLGQPQQGVAPADGLDDAFAQPNSLIPAAVQTTQLSAKDLASIGTIGPDSGGFADTIWDNTGYTQLVTALKAADASPKSPVIQTTFRRLALTIAAMPGVSQRGAWNLLKARLDLLSRTGDLKGMHALASRLPNDLAPNDVLQIKARIALLADDWPMACAAGAQGLKRAGGRYWTAVRLACRASQGNRGAVELLLDTTESSDMPAATVRRAADALLAQTAPVPGMTQPRKPVIDPETSTPLLAAMGRLLRSAPPVKSDPSNPSALSLEPARIASLAHASAQPLGARWPMVLALAYGGRMDGVDVLEYAISAPVNTPADPSLGLAPGQLQRALSAPGESPMVAQLAALSAQSQFSGLPQVWTAAIGEALTYLEPNDALWPRAGVVAAHLAYAGRGAQAARWYDAVRARANPSDVAGAKAVMQAWPWALAANARGRAPFTVRLAELWLQTNGMNDSGAILPKSKVFFAVLEGLGYDLGAQLRVAVDRNLTPLPAPLPAMESAVAKRQTGLAILAGMAALGPGGTLEPEPAALRSVLHTLRMLGQDQLARRIAVEAMFHAGVAAFDAG